jgi:DNA-binding MarR family transcriptional regulator
MKLNLQGYTSKQYAILILRDDMRKTQREIAHRMGMSESGVKHVIDKKR